jgi:hypothetical protein
LEASGAEALRVVRAIETPTRAHGILCEPAGTVLAVSRRPGDWLLRWAPRQPDSQAQWLWSAPDRRYSGHAALDAGGGLLFTSEADLERGSGLIAVRDVRTLETIDEWPAHGIDAHEVLVDADGSLLVANGGVPTRPETGRAKLDRAAMDSSLTRLDSRSGALLGQWRLADPRLSIRHLARHASGVIGAALQAEHDDPAARRAAPLLALFDGRRLDVARQPVALAGYAGDIAATRDGFAVGATRAHCVAHWTAGGRWLRSAPLAEACPLAIDSGTLWAGGRTQALREAGPAGLARCPLPPLRLDNHWSAWTRAA